MEKIKNHFNNEKGLGILSTSNKEGIINSAIYTKPNFLSDNKLSFIMMNKTTYSNLKENPHASFVFIFNEDSKKIGFQIKKTEESNDLDKIKPLIKRKNADIDSFKKGDIFLVYFKIIESKFF